MSPNHLNRRKSGCDMVLNIYEVSVTCIDTTVLIIKLDSTGDGLGQGEV